jgi:chromosome segregation ATPase
MVFEGDVRALREQVGRLTTANRNAECMLTHVLHQRNEAWSEENVLRARQFDLEQQLANAEEYNDNLHEEVHRVNNQFYPYVPPSAAEMDLDEDEDPEEPKAPVEDDDDAVDGDHANISFRVCCNSMSLDTVRPLFLNLSERALDSRSIEQRSLLCILLFFGPSNLGDEDTCGCMIFSHQSFLIFVGSWLTN